MREKWSNLIHFVSLDTMYALKMLDWPGDEANLLLEKSKPKGTQQNEYM